MEITLFRHGKPQISNFNRLTTKAFARWLDAYDQAPLDETCAPSEDAIEHIASRNQVACSTLDRSIKSAYRLGFQGDVMVNSLFNEVGFPNISNDTMRFMAKVWVPIYRSMWLAGNVTGCESLAKVQSRAKAAAQELIRLAEAYGDIALIGHGCFNYFLATELRSMGMQGPSIPNYSYWEFSVYTA